MQTIQLSRRQNEILALIVQGYANKGIAYQLGMSEKTVKNHLTTVFRKLNVESRTQAAVWVMRQNMGTR